MERKRVVITGLGVIGSNGIGKDAFYDAVINGLSGAKPISLFDTSCFKVKSAGEAGGFCAESILGPKGLRTLDRSTRLIVSAVKLALDDASLIINESNSQDTGIVVGTTLGSVNSICQFDIEALREGPRYVNPALFPNTVINSPASQASIRFKITGFNATISTGFSASIDAINYAVDFLRLGRAKYILAGGVEELCKETFVGFYKAGCLAGLKNNTQEISCPFDKRRNGILLGEGAAVLVLEELSAALSRGAQIYAEIVGGGMSFDAYNICEYDIRGRGLRRAMRLALKDAGLNTEDINYICAGANSTQSADLIETAAIKDVFGEDAKKVYVSSVKSMLGECFSASGSLQAAASLAALKRQMIPPNINYAQKDAGCDLNYVLNKTVEARVDKVLINSFGPSGCNSSLIISKFKE